MEPYRALFMVILFRGYHKSWFTVKSHFMPKFYVTTTLPYVNAEPHIGFALELILADAMARFHQLMGDEVVFNTGTDEHGAKLYRIALDRGQEPQQFVDEYAAKFHLLKDALNLSYTNFIRTTSAHHK